MSKLQIYGNSKGRKDNHPSTKTKVVLSFLSAFLCIGLITATTEASFSVTMRVKDVNSNSPTVKAVVKTDTGLKISRTVDLGDKANKADWDVIDLHFFFSNDKQTKIGTGFKACLDSQCKSGTNGPEHKPEVVTFTAKKVNSQDFFGHGAGFQY